MENLSFSSRSNARRAADKMIAAGKAPADQYELVPDGGRRFAIVWPEPPKPEPQKPDKDRWPAGTRVKFAGVIVDRAAADQWRVRLDGAAEDVTIVVTAAELPQRKTREPRQRSGEPRRSKAQELDAAAARGEMPVKPDVTSHANHHYQKRFDKLAELAAAGDWDAVRTYECNGINSYAKMVRQYRDRLVAAHAVD